MENMEILQVIRSSAGVVEVLQTHLVPTDSDSPIRKEKVAKAEAKFAEVLGLEGDELDEALDNGYADESDGDTVSLVWSDITD